MDRLKLFFIPLLLVALNFIVKGFYLSSNSIGGDEPFSIFHAQMDVSMIIDLLSSGNNPPFYELLLHFWMKFFGLSASSVRFPSLIFSCISVLFIYKIGNKYFSNKIGIITGLLFVFSNYQTLFAHEARVYAFFCLLSIMAMYYYLGLITEKQPKKGQLILLLATNLMLIYAHYLGFMILFIQFIFVLINKELRIKYWKQLLIFSVVIALFYLPNISVIINRFLDSSANGTWVAPPEGIKSIYDILRKFSNAPVVTSLVIVILIAAIVKYLIKEKISALVLRNKLILMWFLFPFLSMFFISYWIPMFLDRYLIFISGGFYLLVALASNYLIEKKRYSLVVPVIVCVLFLASTKLNISNKRNVEEVILKVKELKKDNTLILCTYHFGLNFTYYYDTELFKSVNDNMMQNLFKSLEEQNVFGITNISEVPSNNWKTNHIIYVDAATNFLNPDNGILERLNADYDLISHSKIYEIFDVYEYGKLNQNKD